MSPLSRLRTQTCRSCPVLTGPSLPHQAGKVFIVASDRGGIGYELIMILYLARVTGCIMTCSATKTTNVVEAVEASSGACVSVELQSGVSANSPGVLRFLPTDLTDLSSIASSAAAFCTASSCLNVLWNNAGVATARKAARLANVSIAI